MIKNISYRFWALVLLQYGVMFGQPAFRSMDSKALGPDYERTLNLRSELNDEDLLALIAFPGNEQAPIDLLNGQVFYDKNENANVFYYMPGSFNLLYNQRKGKYEIELIYPEDDTGEHRVTFKAQFGSSIDTNTESLLERLLYRITKKPTVKALPLMMETKPIISFPFSEFNIPQENILITDITDYTKPMTVTWSVDQDKIEAFFTSMAYDVNFDGTIKWKNEGSISPSLTIHLSLLTPKNTGKFYYNRPSNLFLKGVKNKTAFRIKLSNILVLNKGKSENLILYKENFTNLIVEPNSTFKNFSPTQKRRINGFAGSELLLEYEILDCEECQRNAKNSIGSYKTTGSTDWIQVWDLGACEFTNAEAIMINVEKPSQKVEINKGEKLNEAFKAPKLLSGDLNYRYKVTLVLPERTWTSRYISNDENQYSIILNKEFIKRHFKQFKNKN